MHIRRGKKEDAYALAIVHVASWRTTYKGIIDESYLAAMDVEEKTQQWEMILRDGDVFVAENEQQIVGFAGGGPERTGAYTGYDAEVYSIYLLFPYQGKGIGRSLLTTIVQFLYDSGYRSLLIWVLADNRSVGFYEAMGGRKIAEERIQIGGQTLMEHAYGWSDLTVFL